MNKVIEMGRLTNEPEIRTFENGGKVANFTIAVDRYNGKDKERTADFIPVSAFGANADNIAKHFHKGQMIIVEGNIQTRSYEKNGEKRYAWGVNLEKFYFSGEKRDKANDEDNQGTPSQPAPSYASAPVPSYSSADNSNFEEIGDDDLPF